MKTSKWWSILALVAVLFALSPAFGRQVPYLNRHSIAELEDHPWGGDLMADHGGGGQGGLFNQTFIGTPLSFVDFFRFMFFTRTRSELPLIRGSAIIGNDNSTPTNSVPTSPNFVPGEGLRGN